MARLFQRSFRLTLGTHDVTGMHIRFKVEKSLKQEPNTASIEIWNLARETRESFEKANTIPIRLEVGYGSELDMIYLGEVRTATSVTTGPEIMSKFEAGDGEKKLGKARISIPLGPKTPADVALRAIAKTLGVGLGNMEGYAKKLASTGLALFPAGRVITGSSVQAMNDFCASAGLAWSVQDGNIQVIDKSRPLDGLAFSLTSNSGLIGSPSVDSKGVVNAQTLFIPGLRPGALLKIESNSVNGGYRAEKCTYSGDFAGQDWYITLEGRSY